jgi:hypothetical protein
LKREVKWNKKANILLALAHRRLNCGVETTDWSGRPE